MKEHKVTWNDLHEGTQKELRDTYGFGTSRVGNKRLEHAVRRHLDGASASEKRSFYNQFYGRK
jgi:hypothetical protein